MRQFCKSLFPVVGYAYCTIPTYPSGQIGFMLCSKNPVSWGLPVVGAPARYGDPFPDELLSLIPRTPTSESPCNS